MSSGRDVMMEQWSNQAEMAEQSLRKSLEHQQKESMIIRMIDYRQTLITEIERLDKVIEELQK